MKARYSARAAGSGRLSKALLRGALVGVTVCWTIIMWNGIVGAADKSVSEEILDILKDKGEISVQQYEELKEKAEEEKKAAEKAGDWNFYWKNGFNLESKDKKFKLKFGGRIQADGAYIAADEEIDAAFQAAGDDKETGWGTEFRRARLFFSGTVYEDIFFNAQYDFGGGDADFKNVLVGVQNIPYIGQTWIGHFKEPNSLEELTSSKYITFMERALPNIFSPSRNMGVEFFNNHFDKRLYWAIGGFQQADDFGFSFNDFSDWNLSLRVTGRPWLQGKDKFVHLGLSYSHGFRNETETGARVRYRQRPEAHLSPNRLVDTGSLFTDDVDLLVPEVALVYGPFSFQGEYFYNKLNSGVENDPTFTGWYAYVSYFVTQGDHRSYKGWSFARVSPNRNFSIKGGGIGAIELALRYSELDLNDEAIRGGKEGDWTFGINWYLTPNTRFQFNYIRANIEDRNSGGVIIADSDMNVFQTRFQIDF
jgi:phosphate-selective porin OprO/OprP